MDAPSSSCSSLVALAGLASALRAARRGDRRYLEVARRSVIASAGLAASAMLLLEAAYVRDDFDFALVAGNSSTTTPLYYKLTAVWSTQAGSLLLWLCVLGAMSVVAVRNFRDEHRELEPITVAVLLAVSAFFAFLMVFYASPFDASPVGTSQGAGLQPLLRYPLMALHPIALYLGYAGATVPFAYAVAALARGRLDASWLTAVRRYAMLAWMFLAAGLVLGSRWSYAELGWGGYWGWDPVENAALLPWLTATAFIHSSVIQERRGMLKIWNVSLVAATFVLSLVGTFLVRSGILDSIHAFGASTLGVPFLLLIAATIALSVGLIVWRVPQLRSEHRLDGILSRETVFLLNNVILVGLAFVVFWGTFFPLISEAVTGTKSALGPPWFELYVTPLGIALVLLLAIGPNLAWKRTRPRALARVLRVPALLAVIAAAAAVSLGTSSTSAVLTTLGAALIVAASTQELARAATARAAATGAGRRRSALDVVRRNRRRYGGYLTHVGFATMLLGVAISGASKSGRDITMRPGDEVTVAGYRVAYERPTTSVRSEKIAFGTSLSIWRGGRRLGTLSPAREYYPSLDLGGSKGTFGRFFDGEATSEIGIRASFGRDLWISAAPDLETLRKPIEEANRRFSTVPPVAQALIINAIAERYVVQAPPVAFRVIVRTGVTWIWVGASVMALGALLALRRPRRRPGARRAALPAPENPARMPYSGVQ
ncbi:heme lyase CcmF/NrfE family subunit [Conexibacter sp. W3-3-2]|uniref:heme lyase CcmF/NrfE family subunit n=1 Tax=Conexibacter sp. W3-3-2 TaxID=2675227 RepID=UPI0012BA34C3|nr:cytochrome c-type biogenesis CcmF C-terminal domain-containing protein [Conexibacter sp. W3-3-2]MTD47565.1 heme lyase CcmF/NrfE family subunit [Conexibacter sp. W3-3-2]